MVEKYVNILTDPYVSHAFTIFPPMKGGGGQKITILLRELT